MLTTKSDVNINIDIDSHINNKINITIINDNSSFDVGGVLRTSTTKTWNIKKISSTLTEVTPISSSSIKKYMNIKIPFFGGGGGVGAIGDRRLGTLARQTLV